MNSAGTGSYVVCETEKIESRGNDLRDTINAVEKEAFARNKRLEALQMEVHKLMSIDDQLVVDINIFRENAV